VRGTAALENRVTPRSSAGWLVALLALVPLPGRAQEPEPEVLAPVPAAPVPAPEAPPAPVPPPSAEALPAEIQPAETPPAEVTILGARVARTPGSAHVIRTKELERYNYDDPHAVLQSVPGVYVRGEDGIGLRPNISIRGVNPDRSKKLTLMEDGILFGPAPYSAPAAYYFPLVTRMTQVRVLKGPSALIYGPQTIGGAVDFITRNPPSTPSGALDAAYGQYGYNKLHGHFGASDENNGFVIEGVHIGADGFKELPNGGDTGFHRNEWMFKGFHSLSGSGSGGMKNELWLKATYSDEISNETYVGLTDADFRREPLSRYGVSQLDRMRWYRTSFALSHVIEPTPRLSITTTLYRHDFFRVWRKVNGFRGASLFDIVTNPDNPEYAAYVGILRGELDGTAGEAILIGPNQREFVSQGLDIKARYATSTGPFEHRIEYGARLHQDRIERLHSENAFNVIGGELVPDGGPTVVTVRNQDSSESLGLHVIDAITLGRLTVTPGARLEVIRLESEDYLSGAEQSQLLRVPLPGVGAFYGITENLGVLAGVYRGFSPPAPGSAEQEPGSSASSSVDPEFSINYEGGVRYTDEPLRAEAIGFYNDYSNLTDVCTLSSGCLDTDLDRQFDAGQARIYGLEAYLSHEIPIGGRVKLPVGLAYTLTFAEFRNSFESGDPIFQPSPSVRRSGRVEPGDELPYVPRHELHASAGVETERFGVSASLTYVSKMREQPGPGSIETSLHTDEQFVMDASGSLRVFGPVTVYSNVRNVFDDHAIVSRRPFGARPNAPRWVQVGAKVEF
jgi:Fe(3+) dicitrate transport protein